MVAILPAHTSLLQRADSYAGLVERRHLTQISRLQVQRGRCHAGVVRAAVGAEDEPVDIDLLASQVHPPNGGLSFLTQRPCPPCMRAIYTCSSHSLPHLAVESGSGAAQACAIRAAELHQCSRRSAWTSTIRSTGWAVWTWGELLTVVSPPPCTHQRARMHAADMPACHATVPAAGKSGASGGWGRGLWRPGF